MKLGVEPRPIRHGKIGVTSAKVGVDAHVPRGAAQRLALAIWNMLLRLRVAVLLGHPKVDHVYNW